MEAASLQDQTGRTKLDVFADEGRMGSHGADQMRGALDGEVRWSAGGKSLGVFPEVIEKVLVVFGFGHALQDLLGGL